MRAHLLAWMLVGCLWLLPSSLLGQTVWPRSDAEWTIRIIKQAGLEPEDDRWMHLHHGHGTAIDADQVTLGVLIYRSNDHFSVMDPAASGLELRYVIRGTPISNWLAPPFDYEVDIDNPAMFGLLDGFHDITLEARGANYLDFKPDPCFLHLTRGLPLEPTVPIITGEFNAEGHSRFGFGIAYVDPMERVSTGHPMNPEVTPWTMPPFSSDLYLEEMAPHTQLFESAQMWWEDPPHPGHPFVRGFPPKHGEDHRSMREFDEHEKFPFRDGPRGIGWMSSYVSGQVDNQGRLVFAEVGGRVARLWPDGYIETIAGWRVKQNKDPVWISKPLNVIRSNMERVGNWSEGLYANGDGFRTPLDVALDPRNPNIIYVAGYEDNCIWRIDASTNNAEISVFAGDPNHAGGFLNGIGHKARFKGPASLVFDPVRNVLYVADQDNDAIRQIDSKRNVTTIFGRPGMADRLASRGVQDQFHQLNCRAASRFEVTASQAFRGIRPDIYLPQCIRVQSNGDIVLLELGYGALRRINPQTGETKKLAEVQQPHEQFRRGWAWFDVDRWGNSGPLDGIYWCKFVGENVDGEAGRRFNEVYAWVPANGGQSRFVFGPDIEAFPDGWGKRSETNPPHYPWLVAVDPRGAVLLAGGGEHGTCRLRVRRANDPVPINPINLYEPGQWLWNSGGDAPGLPSFALKYGWNGHNYLGLRDAWSLTGNETDNQLLDYFFAPDAIRNRPQDRYLWLDFVRMNIGP